MNLRYIPVAAVLSAIGGAAPQAIAQYAIPSDTEYYAVREAAGEGTWTVERGAAWGAPEWLWVDPPGDKSELRVPNRAQPEPWYKKVYVLLTYDTSKWDEDEVPGRGLADLAIIEPAAGVTLDHSDVSLGTGLAYWEWTIRPQPGRETLKFPGMHGYDMHNAMKKMEVGTKCIPEPGVLGLAGLAVLVAARRRR